MLFRCDVMVVDERRSSFHQTQLSQCHAEKYFISLSRRFASARINLDNFLFFQIIPGWTTVDRKSCVLFCVDTLMSSSHCLNGAIDEGGWMLYSEDYLIE